jgi:hypothetical protein
MEEYQIVLGISTTIKTMMKKIAKRTLLLAYNLKLRLEIKFRDKLKNNFNLRKQIRTS